MNTGVFPCFLGFLGLVLQLPVYAQELPDENCALQISGMVLDHHDESALGFANILIKELNVGTTANEKGYYELNNICPGEYTILCSHMGCETVQKRIKLSDTITINFSPEHHQEWLQEVAIVGHRHGGNKTQVSSELSEKQWNKNIGLSLGESLKSIPGVQSLQSGNNVSKPVIQGLHSNRVLVVQNGTRLESQQWGLDHGPEIDPLLFPKSEVLKGAQSVKYGAEAMGGVVLLSSPEFCSNEVPLVHVFSAFNSNDFGGKLGIQVEGGLVGFPKLQYQLAISRSKAGNAKTPDYFLENTGSEETTIAWGLKYTEAFQFRYSNYSSSFGVFSGSHFGNLTDLQDALDGAVLGKGKFSYDFGAPRQEIVHETALLSGNVLLKEVGKLSYSLSRQYNERLEFDAHGVAQSEEAAKLGLTSVNGQVLLELDNRLPDVGLEYRNLGNTARGRSFVPDYELNTIAGFVTHQWLIGKGDAFVEAGARWEQHFQTFFVDQQLVNKEYQSFSGNFGVFIPLRDKHQLRFNLASGWRPPAVTELFADGVHHGAGIYEQGNPKLTEERTISMNPALELHFKGFEGSIEPFVYRFSNYITQIPNGQPELTIRGAFPSFGYAQIPATLYGLDIATQTSLSKTIFLNVNFSSVQVNHSARDNVYFIPSELVGMELSRSWKTEQGNTFSTALGAKYRAEKTNGPILELVAPPEDYTLFSLDLSFQSKDKINPIFIGLKWDNILNKKYRNYANRNRFFADELGTSLSVQMKISFGQKHKK
ncbi:MAG: iron complex outermembrane receptor protein [Sphingobacteriales bacterium]|jgi:iron complex outermembrane receptor protein